MHEYNHFILGNRLLRWYKAITMRPWCIHFGAERNAKKNENLMVTIQQAAANIICSWTWYFFWQNQPTKKDKKIGGKTGETTTTYLYLVCVSHQGPFGQPRTYVRRGRLQKAATTRVRCVVHMCASSVLSRRATSPAPAQRKNCRYFSTWSRWDHEKENSPVFRRSPDRGGIVIISS